MGEAAIQMGGGGVQDGFFFVFVFFIFPKPFWRKVRKKHTIFGGKLGRRWSGAGEMG